MEPGSARGELLDHALRKRTDHNRADPAFEIPRDIRDRFALAERDIRLDGDDVAAELSDGDLERRSSTKRRFFEEHRDVMAADGGRGRRLQPERTIGFQTCCNFETPLEVGGVEIEHREKILPAGHCGCVCHDVRSNAPVFSSDNPH